ncbi:MAG: imidazole glycerol phosphate synthase subunit HisF [Saprospiraceae bacterium]
MLCKRIIPCLDVKDGQTVKGLQFKQLQPAGDPVALAAAYARQGADELVFLDISATQEGRGTFSTLVEAVAAELNIPFTVGGGIGSEAAVERLLHAGADKVSINSAALRDPGLINRLAAAFGSQCIVLAVDVREEPGGFWQVFSTGGQEPTGKAGLAWIQEGVDRGAGEILLTSMTHDGTRQGFAVEFTRLVSQSVSVPVIASGGAGNAAHFVDVFTRGAADAALAAGIFHFGVLQIPDLKQFLRQQGVAVRDI